LWQRLERDLRHTDLVRIEDERCGSRWFPESLMACGDDAEVSPRIDALRAAAPRVPDWSNMIRPIVFTADSRWSADPAG